jgi:hypothetical protein
VPSSPCSALPRIASSTSASTATGGFYASFAMPAPEPFYSHNCAGYSPRGLGKTMVLSAFIVVLLIGASYRGDPSADGPAKRSAQKSASRRRPVLEISTSSTSSQPPLRLAYFPGSTVSPSRCLMR